MKKILLITYYWPPSGGAGVVRWLKFTKFLAQKNIQISVVTTKNGDYPVLDDTLEKEIPNSVEVIRTYTPVFGKFLQKLYKKNETIPYGSMESLPQDSWFKKLSLWIRLNLIVPDARVIWNPFAYQAAKRKLLTEKFDWIVTNSPPHSSQLVGYKLKKKFPHLKWLADFRDPWTSITFYRNVKRWKWIKKIDKFYENSVVINSDLLIGATDGIINDFGKKSHMITLTNGFDETDYNYNLYHTNPIFTIRYFGQITPETDLSFLLILNEKLVAQGMNILFDFYGTCPFAIKELYKNHKFIRFNSYLTRDALFKSMVSAEMLLLFMNKIRVGTLTLKIFEYLGSLRPILGIGPEDCEPAKILWKTESGNMFSYQNLDSAVNYIQNYYKKWQNNEKFGNQVENVQAYNRKVISNKLISLLK